jgi:hypothetical protein
MTLIVYKWFLEFFRVESSIFKFVSMDEDTKKLTLLPPLIKTRKVCKILRTLLWTKARWLLQIRFRKDQWQFDDLKAKIRFQLRLRQELHLSKKSQIIRLNWSRDKYKKTELLWIIWSQKNKYFLLYKFINEITACIKK